MGHELGPPRWAESSLYAARAMVNGANDVRSALRRALRSGRDVEVWRRRFGKDCVHGFVVELSAEWVLIQRIDAGYRLDGWMALRVADITMVKERPRLVPFLARVLRARGEQPRKPAGIALDSTRELIESAGRAFELLCFARERSRPRGYDIGRVVTLDERALTMRLVALDGSYFLGPAEIRLSTITAIDFGAAYDEALVLGAARSPRRRMRAQRSRATPRKSGARAT